MRSSSGPTPCHPRSANCSTGLGLRGSVRAGAAGAGVAGAAAAGAAAKSSGDQKSRGSAHSDAGASGAESFRQRALRGEFHLQFTLQVLARELLVLAHVGGDDTAQAAGVEQHAQPPAVDAAVVRDDLELGGAGGVHLLDEHLRDAAEAEAPDGHAHSVLEALDGLTG